VTTFWNEISAAGTPLVEEAEGGKDVLVTFMLRSEVAVNNALVFASVLPENNPEHQRLAQLPGTDVWFRTFRFHRDVPILYQLSTDGPENLQRDPLNPRFIEGALGGSMVMPRGSVQPGVRKGNQIAGRLDEATFHSNIYNDRKVVTYLPGHFHPKRKYRLVVVMDEEIFSGPVRLPLILDDLIASQRPQPTVVTMVGNVNREVEFSCNSRFSKMLAHELVPWVEERFDIQSRERTTIAGSSLGGLAAACAGFQASDTFDNVIALSGSFRWRPNGDQEPEWFARQIAAAPAVPVSFFVGVGSFETATPHEPANPSLLTAGRHLRDVLRARDYALRYREFPGAHEPLSWSLNVGDALVASQAAPKRNEQSRCTEERPAIGARRIKKQYAVTHDLCV
jgi:enterochelin esterase-like enzyme